MGRRNEENLGIGGILWILFLVVFFYIGILYLAYKLIRWFFFGDKHPEIVYQRRRKFAQIFLFPGLNRFTTGDFFWGIFNFLVFFVTLNSVAQADKNSIPFEIFFNYIIWINECFYVYAYFYKGLDKGRFLRRYWYVWKLRDDYEKISDPIIPSESQSSEPKERKSMPWETQNAKEEFHSANFDIDFQERQPFKIKTEKSKVQTNFKDEFSEDQDKPKRTTRKKGHLSGLEKLNSLVGLKEVKEEIQKLIHLQIINQKRNQMGANVANVNLHSLFLGNPGTGKTEVARLMSEILYEIGYLKKGHLVEADRSRLVAGFIGQTAMKTQSLVEEALGGILFIDEAYNLVNDNQDSFGLEAVNTLLKLMEDHRDEFVLILAGYPDEMEKFLQSNPGLKSRIPNRIYFEDYSPEELLEIWKLGVRSSDYDYNEILNPILLNLFRRIRNYERKNFGNARMVRNLLEATIKEQALRVANQKKANLHKLEKEDIEKAVNKLYKNQIPLEEKEVSLEDLMKELNDLIGLESVKENIRKLVNLQKVQKARNRETSVTQNYHMVFMGNPGTGKTTVARLMGKIFKSLGILTSGHVVEVSRSDLVGQYLGESAIKTKSQMDKAIGGVLFIDEAYSLVNDYGSHIDPYGKEVIDTLVKYMEDYRKDLVVILAGYTQEMERFLTINPGLKSRIRNYFYFEDYSPHELFRILEKFAKDEGYELEGPAEKFIQKFESEVQKNARYIRNILATAMENHAHRVSEANLPEGELHKLRFEDFFPKK